jgi:hypothetical protein
MVTCPWISAALCQGAGRMRHCPGLRPRPSKPHIAIITTTHLRALFARAFSIPPILLCPIVCRPPVLLSPSSCFLVITTATMPPATLPVEVLRVLPPSLLNSVCTSDSKVYTSRQARSLQEGRFFMRWPALRERSLLIDDWSNDRCSTAGSGRIPNLLEPFGGLHSGATRRRYLP